MKSNVLNVSSYVATYLQVEAYPQNKFVPNNSYVRCSNDHKHKLQNRVPWVPPGYLHHVSVTWVINYLLKF